METIIVKNWYDVISNVPSWIRYKLIPVGYAKATAGFALTVPKVEPALELPVFKSNAPFTRAVLTDYISRHGGSGFNFAVSRNGSWYLMENPFVVHNGARKYISPEMLEALNLCAGLLPDPEYRTVLDKLFVPGKNTSFLGH